MYSVIEDHSPYYLTFHHQAQDQIIEYCRNLLPSIKMKFGFQHYPLPVVSANYLLDLVPLHKILPLQSHRVSLFITSPGYYYRAHKDGLDHQFSINYMISVLDSSCVTNWYSDQDLIHYPIDPFLLMKGVSRECIRFTKSAHSPVKSVVFSQGQGILFNTDLFHDFDNRSSQHYRVVLTFRALQPNRYSYEHVRQLLFECAAI